MNPIQQRGFCNGWRYRDWPWPWTLWAFHWWKPWQKFQMWQPVRFTGLFFRKSVMQDFGGTVQVIPHITNEIKKSFLQSKIRRRRQNCDHRVGAVQSVILRASRSWNPSVSSSMMWDTRQCDPYPCNSDPVSPCFRRDEDQTHPGQCKRTSGNGNPAGCPGMQKWVSSLTEDIRERLPCSVMPASTSQNPWMWNIYMKLLYVMERESQT